MSKMVISRLEILVHLLKNLSLVCILFLKLYNIHINVSLSRKNSMGTIFDYHKIFGLIVDFKPLPVRPFQSLCFLGRPHKLMKSSPSMWHLMHNVKSTVKEFVNLCSFLRKHQLYLALKMNSVVVLSTQVSDEFFVDFLKSRTMYPIFCWKNNPWGNCF